MFLWVKLLKHKCVFVPQVLFEATVKGIPHRVLGSASYQVGKMDVLNVSASGSAVYHIFINSFHANALKDDW